MTKVLTSMIERKPGNSNEITHCENVLRYSMPRDLKNITIITES